MKNEFMKMIPMNYLLFNRGFRWLQTLFGLYLVVSGSQAAIQQISPIRDVLVWSGSLFSHLFFLSTRGQCRAANNLGTLKLKSKEPLKGPWQLNSGPFGWKTRLSLKPEETFHVIDQPFNFFWGGDLCTELPVIHGVDAEASDDFHEADTDRIWTSGPSQSRGRLPAAVALRSV